MPDGAAEPSAPVQRRARRKLNLRPGLRALHRDVGYFAVGLTIVYATSGLAVNHLKDWDPNFSQVNRTHQLPLPLPSDDQAAADSALRTLGVREQPREVYRASDSQLDLVFDQRTFHVDTASGVVHEEGQSARPLLRIANWLHLNRGKKAWTYIADFYAVFLLFLAFSGLFMIPGRKGLFGRGALIALLGAAVPIAYVLLSGGP
ncbi:MAG TPA: PepSY-associated TM helix domain-containing protein [Polyangiaceae bacterium]|nr:PepSY-associated TM helix domain-containing protein [Polyangiaceae bacterium]